MLDAIQADIAKPGASSGASGKETCAPRGQGDKNKPGNEKPTAAEAEKVNKKPEKGDKKGDSAQKTGEKKADSPTTEGGHVAMMAAMQKTLNSLAGVVGGFNTKLDSVNEDIKSLKSGQQVLEDQWTDWESYQYHNSDADNQLTEEYSDEEEGEVGSPPPKKPRGQGEQPDSEEGASAAGAPASDLLMSVKQDCGLSQVKETAIQESWAEVINTLATSGLQEKALTERKNKIADIENVDMLVAPRLNDCVWNVISKDTKARDAVVQNIQKSIMKGLVPIIQVGDALLKAAQDKKDLPNAQEAFAKMADGVTLVLAGNHNLNMLRRDMVKPDLNRDFKSICSQNCPITANLFGEDLPKRLKEIGDSNKAGAKVKSFRPSFGRGWHSDGNRGAYGRGSYRGAFGGARGRGRGYAPYNSWSSGFSQYGRGRGRGNFLATGPSPNRKPEGAYKKK